MKKIVPLLAAILLTSGCALTTAQIDIPYQPAAPAQVVQGAANTKVDVTATDGRTTYRDRVSSKKNGYGMEMAAITPNHDVVVAVGDAFKQELTARGFVMATGGAAVQVEVVRFYNDFKAGFFAGDAVANVAYNVKLVSPGGTILFAKYYEGAGTVPNIQLASANNAREALVKAFSVSVNSAVSDPDFIAALVKAGGPAMATVAVALPTS